MKKSHLSHEEILAYEGLSLAEISSVFFSLGVQKGSQLFWLMLQSYRIITRVANAAWTVTKAFDEDPMSTKKVSEAMNVLRSALHDYAPQHLVPYAGDLEFAGDCFEKFYEQAAATTTRAEVEELIFTWTNNLRAQAAQKSGKKFSVEEIVRVSRDGQRNAVENNA